MALDPLEWGIVLLMGAGILIWGPDKIPEMAKTLASARKQLDGATKQLSGITKELQSGISSGNLNIDTLSNALLGAGMAGTAEEKPAPGQAVVPQGSPTPAVTPVGDAVALPAPPKSSDQMLIEMARILKIETRGKTKDEISKAITEAVSAIPAGAAPVEAPAAESPPPAASPAEPQAAPPVEAQPAPSPSKEGAPAAAAQSQ